jgi:Holliday junction resolvase RusA-like endonuclease
MIRCQLDICPKPTPRPRQGINRKTGKKIFHYPTKYHKYKDDLLLLIKSKKIPKKDYKEIWATFLVKYPKQYKGGEKAKIENAPMRQKFDCDNVLKGLLDGLQQANVIEDDRQIYITHTSKLWTKGEPKIIFVLK